MFLVMHKILDTPEFDEDARHKTATVRTQKILIIKRHAA